ncbi:uncharacterized protein [Palaemon carinicauda]|uniref:uncharacterized protein n=1 Tax=Palaemon carinicauda TaxID=392227 RepID=UPI0035B599C0
MYASIQESDPVPGTYGIQDQHQEVSTNCSSEVPMSRYALEPTVTSPLNSIKEEERDSGISQETTIIQQAMSVFLTLKKLFLFPAVHIRLILDSKVIMVPDLSVPSNQLADEGPQQAEVFLRNSSASGSQVAPDQLVPSNIGIAAEANSSAGPSSVSTAKLLWAEEEDESKLNIEFEACESYLDKINFFIATLEATKDSVPPHSVLEEARSLLKSPTAPLPVFKSVEGENIEKFLSEFEEVIKTFKYTQRDKLLLLKQQVSGRASILLDSLETNKQTYEDAKLILRSALASPRFQKFTLIKQLTDMKMPYQTDPFAYVGQMKNFMESVKLLKMEVDDFLNYFFWNGMNSTFQSQLVNITNKTRPSLSEINDNIFEACERYGIASQKIYTKVKKFPKTSETVNLASNVNVEGQPTKAKCSLCAYDRATDDHQVFKCPVYNSNKAKVDKLKEIGGCLKCASSSHSAGLCKFRLHKKCRGCNGWHFTFLCIKKDSPKEEVVNVRSLNKNSNLVNEKSEKVSTGVVFSVDALQCYGNRSALPTFTSQLEDHTQIRGLQDSGCQCNFITDRAVKKIQFKVLRRNVSLTVNGFNSAKSYNTKVVELNLKFGQEICKVEALCVPYININLKLPNLFRVASHFSAKGYTLADKQLLNNGDELNSIDFILGTNSAHCTMASTVRFGQDSPSVYFQTSFGVMLLGNVDTMLKNLYCLPDLNAVETSITCKSDNAQLDVGSLDSIGLGLGKFNDESILEHEEMVVEANFLVLNENGGINEQALQRATEQMLEYDCKRILNYDKEENETSVELNNSLVRYALNNATVNEDGRISMPLLWNSKVSHLLGKNYKLAEAVLKSNLKKLCRREMHLKLMDEVIKEQENLGIIEKIPNLKHYLTEHPEHSFLPHMGVFKLDRETTKCRVVFLSNIFEADPRKPMTVSHNQAIHPGPSLNQKLSSALLHLRFGSKIFCFDLKKAFYQIALRPSDQNKLLFLWVRSVKKKDFSLVGYKNLRLTFGLRCSPTILMLSLYKILVLDMEDDNQEVKNMKKLLYQLFYMDNGAYTCKNSDILEWAYTRLTNIFSPYRIELQQIVTNDGPLQEVIDSDWDQHILTEVKLLAVKRVVKDCVICKRYKEHTIRLNQSPYREFRMDPSQIPFSYVYVDYFGPYFVKQQGSKVKDGLRDVPDESVPSPITPEILIYGYELTSVNIIPELQCDPELDGEYDLKDSPSRIIEDTYSKLRKVRETLIRIYHSEFLTTLINQAVDKTDRYKPVTHKIIEAGDIVLLKDPHTKALNYPLGIVKGVVKNDLGEVTNAQILKGKSGEVVKRHVTSLIPLLRDKGCISGIAPSVRPKKTIAVDSNYRYPKRAAAVASGLRTKDMLLE